MNYSYELWPLTLSACEIDASARPLPWKWVFPLHWATCHSLKLSLHSIRNIRNKKFSVMLKRRQSYHAVLLPRRSTSALKLAGRHFDKQYYEFTVREYTLASVIHDVMQQLFFCVCKAIVKSVAMGVWSSFDLWPPESRLLTQQTLFASEL